MKKSFTNNSKLKLTKGLTKSFITNIMEEATMDMYGVNKTMKNRKIRQIRMGLLGEESLQIVIEIAITHICHIMLMKRKVITLNWIIIKMAILLLGIAYDTSDAGTGGPKYLAIQLTLFQPGWADYPYLPIATGTLKVFHLTASLNPIIILSKFLPWIVLNPFDLLSICYIVHKLYPDTPG